MAAQTHFSGEKIGNRTLLEYVGVKSNNRMWTWKCDCSDAVHGPASIRDISRYKQCSNCSVKGGNPKQLPFGGHSIGEIINGKILVSYNGLNQHGSHVWDWECPNCHGINGPSTISYLNQKYKFCKKCAKKANHSKWNGFQELGRAKFNSYKRGASIRGIQFSISIEDAWEAWVKADGKCAYTGLNLDIRETASLDRIDNNFGYVPTNIHWVHKDVNKLKSNFSEERFIELCRQVTTHRAEPT